MIWFKTCERGSCNEFQFVPVHRSSELACRNSCVCARGHQGSLYAALFHCLLEEAHPPLRTQIAKVVQGK